MNYDELCDHLEFSIEHGGFQSDSLQQVGWQQGGCSCEVCTFLRNYLEKETKSNDNNTSQPTK